MTGTRRNRWILAAAVMCFLMFAPVMTSYAAYGTLQFTDPSGEVGKEITVKVKMDANGQPIGDGMATISYDPSKLEFVSGTNATGGNGTVSLSASGTGAETELSFELIFRGMSEGTATIDVTDCTAYLFSDETLELERGSATVTIGAEGSGMGESSTSAERITGEANIEIAGTMYAIYENFTDALVPEGFTRVSAQYAGAEHNAIQQDATGKLFFFLITGTNDPIMALYNEGEGSLSVTERVDVTDSFYILLLGNGDGSVLPKHFDETTLELNGTVFPAWQNMEAKEYYLVYALSSKGSEGFYQYDTVDATYQRYTVSEEGEKKSEKPKSSFMGKLEDLMENYILIAAAVVGVVVLIMLIMIIVLSTKLNRRNEELEEMYDDGDGGAAPSGRASRKSFSRRKDSYEDDFGDRYDDDYDDAYEEDYGDEYDDYDDTYEEDYDDEYDEEYDDEYEDGYDDGYDAYDDSEEDVAEYVPKRKLGTQNGKSSSKNTGYGLDFIDL